MVKDSKDVKKKLSDTEAILDAVRELTTQIADNTKVLSAMKKTHDKWIKAGKF